MYKIVIAASILLFAHALFAKQVTNADISKAAETLLKTQKAPEAWKVMGAVYKDDRHSADIRSRVIYLSALRQLIGMNTNRYTATVQNLLATYPQEGQDLNKRITADDWLAPCPDCKGKGERPSLVGQAKLVPCLTCRGSGKIFSLSKQANAQYRQLFQEILTIANNNMAFATAQEKAFAERYSSKRIKALKELLTTYSTRTDLGKARNELERLEKEAREKAEKERQRKLEREAMEREERAYAKICTVTEHPATEAIPTLVQEIDRFLQTYPKSNYRLDLEILKAKLLKKKAIQDWIWRAVWILAGLTVISTIATAIKNGLAKKEKKGTQPLPLPGLNQALDRPDPLAGVFEEEDEDEKPSQPE